MNPDEFEKTMKELFPAMFDGKDIGIWVGPGWHKLVTLLCHKIQHHTVARNSRRQWLLANNPDHEHIPDEVPQVIIGQIKEKFGELRFYYDGGDDYIAGLVDMAEVMSYHICEDCGNPGMLRQDLRWVKVLCDKHHQERLEKQNPNTTWVEP